MAYFGQIHSLRVPIKATWDVERLAQAFVDEYRKEFGNTLGGIPVVVVNMRTRVLGMRAAGARKEKRIAGNAVATPIRRRPVYFGGWIDAAIYDRTTLEPGMAFDGPAIVEQNDCTTVVEPGMNVRVDGVGNLLVEMK